MAAFYYAQLRDITASCVLNFFFRFLALMAKLYILVTARVMASIPLQPILMEYTSTVSATKCRPWRQRYSCSAWISENSRKME